MDSFNWYSNVEVYEPRTEPLRIGLCGSHGTGKTSVAEQFAQCNAVRLVTSASRRVKELGWDINEDASCLSQAATSMARLADQLTAGEHFISDRTLLDSMAYNRYQLENVWGFNEQARFWYDTMDAITKHQMDFYDYLVYVPITFPLVADGVRAEDDEYQRTIDRYVLEFLGKYQLEFFVMPPGTVAERLDWLQRLTTL